MYKKFSLVIRGPIVKSTEHMLPNTVYELALLHGLELLEDGEKSSLVVSRVSEVLTVASKNQNYYDVKAPRRKEMGPWNSFSAIALDRTKTISVINRKHPNSPDVTYLAENSGLRTSSEGCISIAAPYKDANKAAEALGDTPTPHSLCLYMNEAKKEEDEYPLGGISMTKSGRIGVAISYGFMPWAASTGMDKFYFGFKKRDCRDFL